MLVEVRQLGGAFARRGEHQSAFSSRDAAYSLLIVGIAGVPGVEDHAAAILDAMEPWTGGHRLPNFTFTPEEYVDAYDEATLARLRAGDPHLRPGRGHGDRRRAGVTPATRGPWDRGPRVAGRWLNPPATTQRSRASGTRLAGRR